MPSAARRVTLVDGQAEARAACVLDPTPCDLRADPGARQPRPGAIIAGFESLLMELLRLQSLDIRDQVGDSLLNLGFVTLTDAGE